MEWMLFRSSEVHVMSQILIQNSRHSNKSASTFNDNNHSVHGGIVMVKQELVNELFMLNFLVNLSNGQIKKKNTT